MEPIPGWEKPYQNLSGALAFVSYAAAVLSFTALAIYNLRRSRNGLHLERPHYRQTRNLLELLAIASLAVSSYRMLEYLMQSYSMHTILRRSFLQRTTPADERFRVSWPYRNEWHLVEWLMSANLFADFAELVVTGDAKYWWTMQALLASMVCSCWIASEARRRRLADAWVYLAMAQYLPMSFTLNLFLLAIMQSPHVNADGRSRTGDNDGTSVSAAGETSPNKNGPVDQGSFAFHLFAYQSPVLSCILVLSWLPSIVYSRGFPSIMLDLHLLLLAPWLIPYVLPANALNIPQSGSRRLGTLARYTRAVYIFLGAMWLLLLLRQTRLVVREEVDECAETSGIVAVMCKLRWGFNSSLPATLLASDFVISLVTAVSVWWTKALDL